MFEKVKLIADGLRSFSKRVGYVAKIIVWIIESLGKLAAILDTFPQSDLGVHPKDSGAQNNGNGRTSGVAGGDNTSLQQKQVQKPD